MILASHEQPTAGLWYW